MYRDRILEEKKRLNLSARSMADMTKLHLTEETISRFLSGKTNDIGLNNFLDIAQTVGLKPYEAFMDATLAAEFRAFLELKTKGDETEAERVKLLADNEQLTTINAGLADKIRVLEMKLAYVEEINAIYKHFTQGKE
jgi:transcriptional regulator with XRE-family HTH domain